MNNKKQPPVLDFFGNEIEVGDEVAYPYDDGAGGYEIDKGVVTQVDQFNTYFKIQIDGYGFYSADAVIVNTEKKHREKALDYLVAEAQEMGMYEDGVGVNTTKDGYE